MDWYLISSIWANNGRNQPDVALQSRGGVAEDVEITETSLTMSTPLFHCPCGLVTQ